MTTPEEQAAHDADLDRQLRDLAAQIAKMTKLPFDPVNVRKGVVAGVADTATPPTVSLNLSGDTESIVTEVRTLNNYTPLVGQTVLVAKQGNEIFILGAIASINPKTASDATTSDNGWTKAVLTNGTHNGGGNGDVYYRRVLDHGSWKMQWRGGWAPSGSNTTMLSSGDALDPDYRPASLRSVAVTRNSDGSVYLRMDFAADGTIAYLNGTPRILTTGDLGGSANSAGSHAHSFEDWFSATEHFTNGTASAGSHTHGIDTGSHSHGGFTDIGTPTWVSLNGVEYFL